MSHIDETDEFTFRSALVADVDSIDLAGHVFDRRRQIGSRNEFFEKLTVPVAGNSEVRFTEIELINIEDDPDEGFDDCPVAVCTYNLHTFHEFADLRSDDTYSDRNFTDLLLQLRTFFLDKREYNISGWRVVVEPLTPDEFTQFGSDSLTDVNGHFKDFTLQARFYDE